MVFLTLDPQVIQNSRDYVLRAYHCMTKQEHFRNSNICDHTVAMLDAEICLPLPQAGKHSQLYWLSRIVDKNIYFRVL